MGGREKDGQETMNMLCKMRLNPKISGISKHKSCLHGIIKLFGPERLRLVVN
jgi:hypothetical protein